MFEFNDQICKSSWNFKSIGWKLTILEILADVHLLAEVNLKNNCWIKWANVQILFKFQVNWMKIVNFRNLADVIIFYFFATHWDWHNLSTSQPRSWPTALHLFWIWFWPISQKRSAVLLLLQLIHLTICLLKRSSIWLLLENHLSADESSISLKPTARVFKQPSNFETGLPFPLSPT